MMEHKADDQSNDKEYGFLRGTGGAPTADDQEELSNRPHLLDSDVAYLHESEVIEFWKHTKEVKGDLSPEQLLDEHLQAIRTTLENPFENSSELIEFHLWGTEILYGYLERMGSPSSHDLLNDSDVQQSSHDRDAEDFASEDEG